MAINYRGKEATSTWTSRRQSFHSSVPLILPTILPNKRFLPFVYKFCTKFITPPSIHHSIKIASIQQNFSNYLKNYFQDISNSRETLLLRKIQNTLSRVVSLSLSLFFSQETERARATLGGFLNEHPIWKLVRREFVTALILNHRVRWKLGRRALSEGTVSGRKTESEREKGG